VEGMGFNERRIRRRVWACSLGSSCSGCRNWCSCIWRNCTLLH